MLDDENAALLPELRLARAALSLFVKDATDHLHGKHGRNAKINNEMQSAFDDLLRCGHMTRRLCRHIDIDADYLSWKFREYVKRHYSER